MALVACFGATSSTGGQSASRLIGRGWFPLPVSREDHRPDFTWRRRKLKEKRGNRRRRSWGGGGSFFLIVLVSLSRCWWNVLVVSLCVSMCLWAPVCRTCQTAGSGYRSPAADGCKLSSAGGRGTSLYPWLQGNKQNQKTYVCQRCSVPVSPQEGDKARQYEKTCRACVCYRADCSCSVWWFSPSLPLYAEDEEEERGRGGWSVRAHGNNQTNLF